MEADSSGIDEKMMNRIIAKHHERNENVYEEINPDSLCHLTSTNYEVSNKISKDPAVHGTSEKVLNIYRCKEAMDYNIPREFVSTDDVQEHLPIQITTNVSYSDAPLLIPSNFMESDIPDDWNSFLNTTLLENFVSENESDCYLQMEPYKSPKILVDVTGEGFTLITTSSSTEDINCEQKQYAAEPKYWSINELDDISSNVIISEPQSVLRNQSQNGISNPTLDMNKKILINESSKSTARSYDITDTISKHKTDALDSDLSDEIKSNNLESYSTASFLDRNQCLPLKVLDAAKLLLRDVMNASENFTNSVITNYIRNMHFALGIADCSSEETANQRQYIVNHLFNQGETFGKPNVDTANNFKAQIELILQTFIQQFDLKCCCAGDLSKWREICQIEDSIERQQMQFHYQEYIERRKSFQLTFNDYLKLNTFDVK